MLSGANPADTTGVGKVYKRTHPATYGHLKSLELFRGLPKDAVETFADRIPIHHCYKARPRTFERRALHVVAVGMGKLSYSTEHGHRLLDAVVRPGDVFGDVSAVGEYSYQLEPLEYMQILAIQEPVFEDLVVRVPAMCWRIVERMEIRRVRLQRRVESLMFKDVPARVAEALLDLSADGDSLSVRVTQQDIADLVGASRQMVNRVLRQLAEDEVIARAGADTTILDQAALESLAHDGDDSDS